jgi:hypothetical protein
MGFETLDENAERELFRLYWYYWREAKRCRDTKAYLAGCVMLGSALETLLMLIVNVYPEEAEATGCMPKYGGKPKPLLKWSLQELLAVAKGAGWLPSTLKVGEDEWSERRAQVGDYAEITRMIRNLAHPARYHLDHSRKRVTAKYLEQQFKIVQACKEWLEKYNLDRLTEHMRQKGLM